MRIAGAEGYLIRLRAGKTLSYRREIWLVLRDDAVCDPAPACCPAMVRSLARPAFGRCPGIIVPAWKVTPMHGGCNPYGAIACAATHWNPMALCGCGYIR